MLLIFRRRSNQAASGKGRTPNRRVAAMKAVLKLQAYARVWKAKKKRKFRAVLKIQVTRGLVRAGSLGCK